MTTQEILTAIRAEIERRLSYYHPENVNHGLASGFREDGKAIAYEELLPFLDTLGEKSEKPTIEQYRAWIISEVEKKFEEAKKNFTEACDSGDALRMFDEAEKDAWESVLRWFKELHGYDVAPFENVPMEIEDSVDLEKEIKEYCGTRDICPVPDFIDAVARHFYELGMNAK